MLQSQHAPGWSPRQNRCCHLTARVTKWYRLGFSLEVFTGQLGAIQLAQSREAAFDCIKDHAPEDLKILSMRCFGNRRTQAGKKFGGEVGFLRLTMPSAGCTCPIWRRVIDLHQSLAQHWAQAL